MMNLQRFDTRSRVPAGTVAGTRLGGVLILDPQGRIRFCDRGLALLFGHEPADMTHRPIRNFLPDLAASLCDGPDPSWRISPGPHRSSVITAGGQRRNVDLWCQDLEGQRPAMKVVEVRYRPPATTGDGWSQLLRRIRASRDAIMITDREGRIEYMNPSFEAAAGCRAVQMLGRKVSFARRRGLNRSGDDAALLARLLTGKMLSGVRVHWGVDGEQKQMAMDVRPYVSRSGGVSHFIYTAREESPGKRELEELAYAATHDPLTALPNRRLFLERFRAALQRANRHGTACTLAFLDVDNLKPVNDTHGHGMGDMLLKVLANRLTHCSREADTVARLGGDEFGLLLADTTDRASSVRVFDHILAVANAPFTTRGASIRASVSIGACFCPAGDDDPEIYLEQADAAMYAAKRAGGNQYHFFSAAATWPLIPWTAAEGGGGRDYA